MKILLLLLVFLLCKEGKSSVSEQSAGSGDFSDTEEDENKTETTQSSDDEYDVYYVNRLFFYQLPTPSYLKIIVSAQQADPGGKMPLLPDLDLKTGKFIFFSGKCLHFFTIFFQYFSYGQRINAAAASTRARSKKGVK